MEEPTAIRSFCLGIILLAAPLAGYGLDVGADFGYVLGMYNVTNPAAPPPVTSTTNYLRADFFVDIDYLLIRAGGMMNAGSIYSTSPTPDNARIFILTADLLGKLPVTIGVLRLWTAVGLRYTYVLLVDFDGNGVDDRPADAVPSDLAVILEVGGCFKIGKKFVLGGSFLIHYDVIPNLPAGAPADATSTSITLEFTLHVGVSL